MLTDPHAAPQEAQDAHLAPYMDAHQLPCQNQSMLTCCRTWKAHLLHYKEHRMLTCCHELNAHLLPYMRLSPATYSQNHCVQQDRRCNSLLSLHAHLS